jgi:hypothetical protein
MPETSAWPLARPRQLQHGQQTQVWVADVASWSAELVHTSDDVLLEAPNWAPDGHSLLLNGDGVLWRLDLDSSVGPEQVVNDLPPINNDHVLDPETLAAACRFSHRRLVSASVTQRHVRDISELSERHPGASSRP